MDWISQLRPGVPSLDLFNFLRIGSTNIVRYHIDHRTIETITWEPWLDSEVSEIEDVLTAKLLSRKRMLLQVPNGNCEYYFGDRCWRQLEGEAHIPLDSPLSMSPHISPVALHEMRQAGFLDCEQFVDLQLRRGSDVRVVLLPPGVGARTRQRESGPRTRGGGTSRRRRGTGDDY
ncbi:hypothetical protein GIB67_022267 [Kingdonia uniflora]|uniref:Uncharacterized protein n=1 Tax=Kingdonia uniflora TaxID=39325 RepID=A0A7J7M6Z5_9MAGN|nr:hypothetical protein GIB67_022267 [Kingdonia uniflora]